MQTTRSCSRAADKKENSPRQAGEVLFFMPVVGVEPTRVISTRDFESPSSAIPTHRRIVF